MTKPRDYSSRSISGRSAGKPKIYIYSEGRVTEKIYLNSFKSRGARTIIYRKLGADPVSLLKAAKKGRKELQHKGSEFWCVFDVDERWQEIPRMLSEAERAGVSVAVSNPCFELWLLLHRYDQHAFIDRKEAQKLADEQAILDGKLPRQSFLDETETRKLYLEAKKRAIALEQQHRANGNSDFHNPSSNVWKLIDSILDLSE